MTTTENAQLYLTQHLKEWEDKDYEVYNPGKLPLEELPVIWGFNNGGSKYFLSATLIAEDGTTLGGHACSDEGYMPHDLGILKGSRRDRHKEFKAHYPNGYRMDFVPYDEIPNHEELNKAFQKSYQQRERNTLNEN